MRQLLIRGLLPILFCLLPLLGAGLVLMCIPHKALAYFWSHAGPMEGLILIGGCLLFLLQMVLCFRALRWQGTSFDEASDRWINNLAQTAEWFPMLGLIGTVAGILEAFKVSGESAGGAIQPSIIAPAITATGSGLFMALINILPAWVVLLGRDMILMLSGITPSRPEEPT